MHQPDDFSLLSFKPLQKKAFDAQLDQPAASLRGEDAQELLFLWSSGSKDTWPVC